MITDSFMDAKLGGGRGVGGGGEEERGARKKKEKNSPSFLREVIEADTEMSWYARYINYSSYN